MFRIGAENKMSTTFAGSGESTEIDEARDTRSSTIPSWFEKEEEEMEGEQASEAKVRHIFQVVLLQIIINVFYMTKSEDKIAFRE